MTPFKIVWTGTNYRVSIPQYTGGLVVHLADHEQIVSEQRALIEQQAQEIELLKQDDKDRCMLIRDMEEDERRKETEITELTLRRTETVAMCEQLQGEIARLQEELTCAEMSLRSKGYRKNCDIPACNCGPQWNHGGHADMRLREISDLLPYINGLTIIQRIERLLEKKEHP